MTSVTTDIDIDFADRNKALEGLACVPAAMLSERHGAQRHASGVYFQNIPVDPLTGLAAYDYDKAAELGYFKIDFLNNRIYQGVRDEEHLRRLIATEPPWECFEDREIVETLAHIHSHFGTVQAIRPRSIEDLAVVLALIRPGKKHLIGRSRDEIDREIWDQDDGGYTYKKSHAISYAMSIVVQLNLMAEEMS